MSTKRPPEPLTPDEVQALLDAATGRGSSHLRLRALIGVLYGAGLRIQEALDLLPRDVDRSRCTVRVRHGKGDSDRTVKIDSRSCAYLDTWMERRRQLGLTGRHPIFATYSSHAFGESMKASYARVALRRLAGKAGVDKPVRPHGLRHGHAYELAEAGVPVHKIQRQLGHSSLATTERYISHLRPGDLEVNVMPDA